MRTVWDVLRQPEEKENLRSGGIVISILCALIIVMFLALNLNIGIEPGAATVMVTESVDLDD